MRRCLSSILLVLGFVSLLPGHAAAEPRRMAIVFLVDRDSFERFLRVADYRQLGRAGGIGLMSPRTAPGDVGAGAYLTLGAGARTAAPFPPRVRHDRTARVQDWWELVRTNGGRSVPGLLAAVLERRGLRSCPSGIIERSALVTADRRGASIVAGGPCSLTVVSVRGNLPRGALAKWLLAAGSSDILVMVAEARPTPAMERVKDEVVPIAMAEGEARTMLDARGPMHTLTSATTRRVGLVSNEDVAPTILRFFRIPIPSQMNGSPIRVARAPPPIRMQGMHLANRRTAVPLSIGVFVAESVIGFLALALVLLRHPPWTAADRAAVALPLFIPAMAVATLAAGSLPILSYPWLIGLIVGAAIVGAGLGLTVRRRGPLVAGAVVATGVLGFFVVEALRGWPDTLFPVLGGSALDGARFFGLPNTYIGVVLGAGVWLAAALPPYGGFVLLFGLGLFAGLPDLGADVGGALTLFAAAALWFVVRVRRRLAWREAAVAVGVVAVGLALVFAASVFLTSAPTHATRFVEGAGNRTVLDTALERLSTSWRLLTRFPLTWIIVAGLPLCLWLALRPPGQMATSFARHPEWRDAMVILVLASIVAFVGNDTGAAAAGFGFGFAIAGILYLPLAERAATPGR